jgi:hypothetical protein
MTGGDEFPFRSTAMCKVLYLQRHRAEASRPDRFDPFGTPSGSSRT